MLESISIVPLLGMGFARLNSNGVLNVLFGSLRAGRGGWLLTANLDFLRRFVKDEEMRALYGAADVVIADGMPIVWATRLLGDPLPERVAGSTLLMDMACRAAQEGRSVYLLGGGPGAGKEAAAVLVRRLPRLRVAGCSSPWVSSPPTEVELQAAVTEIERSNPDILLVGLGSPKQEYLIRSLRHRFPAMWMVGVGVSFSFISGQINRAPLWVQNIGMEWGYRLLQEPRRLARRYLVEDLPFALGLFARVLAARLGGRHGRVGAGDSDFQR